MVFKIRNHPVHLIYSFIEVLDLSFDFLINIYYSIMAHTFFYLTVMTNELFEEKWKNQGVALKTNKHHNNSLICKLYLVFQLLPVLFPYSRISLVWDSESGLILNIGWWLQETTRTLFDIPQYLLSPLLWLQALKSHNVSRGHMLL